MTSVLTIPRTVRVTHLPRTFALELGGVLDAPHVAFESLGPDDGPTVVVLGGISAGRQVAGDRGFWPDLVGPGRAIDTGVVRVVGIDFLGGDGASTNATVVGAKLPSITPRDQAHAIAAVCDELDVARLHAIVGASYGGQVALAFGAEFSTRVRRVVALCAAHQSHPLATAWRALQRQIVAFGIRTGELTTALELARGLAMTTYRSAAEFTDRFVAQPRRADDGWRFEVEDYLAVRGRAFARRFAPEAFLTLSESLDLHRVDPRTIAVPTSLVGFDTDVLVPPWQLRALHGALPQAGALHEISTPFGHDGFLKEIRALEPILRDATEVGR